MSSETPVTPRDIPPFYRARIRAARCCVCRRPREAEQAFQSLVCARSVCAHTYRRLHARRRREPVALPLPPKGVPTCRVCDWPLTPRELSQPAVMTHVVGGRGVCTDYTCRSEWSERRRADAEAAARDARLLTERVTRHRDDAAPALGEEHPERFPIVRVPYNARRLVNLAESRRRRFRDLLDRLIAQAVLPVVPADDPEPELHWPEVPPAALPGVIRACTMCRGNCCFDGADHAHLRVEDIRSHMAAHPDQRPRDVHRAFMERLGQRVYEDSCLFHGERGCELGELRGLTCRRHFCDGLRGYQRDVREGASPRAYVVSLGPGIKAHYSPGEAPTSEAPIAAGGFVDGGCVDGEPVEEGSKP